MWGYGDGGWLGEDAEVDEMVDEMRW